MSNFPHLRLVMRDIYTNPNISKHATSVAVYLLHRMQDDYTGAFPSVATICAELKMGRRQVIDATAELEIAGILTAGEKKIGRGVKSYSANLGQITQLRIAAPSCIENQKLLTGAAGEPVQPGNQCNGGTGAAGELQVCSRGTSAVPLLHTEEDHLSDHLSDHKKEAPPFSQEGDLLGAKEEAQPLGAQTVHGQPSAAESETRARDLAALSSRMINQPPTPDPTPATQPYRVKTDAEVKTRGGDGPLRHNPALGTLEFVNGAGQALKESLLARFPGINLDVVLAKSAPKIAKEAPAVWPSILAQQAAYETGGPANAQKRKQPALSFEERKRRNSF